MFYVKGTETYTALALSFSFSLIPVLINITKIPLVVVIRLRHVLTVAVSQISHQGFIAKNGIGNETALESGEGDERPHRKNNNYTRRGQFTLYYMKYTRGGWQILFYANILFGI